MPRLAPIPPFEPGVMDNFRHAAAPGAGQRPLEVRKSFRECPSQSNLALVVLGQEQSAAGRPALRAAGLLEDCPGYEDEFYESEGALCTYDLDPITFCEECAPEAGDLVPMPNSPRVGVKCYDNAHSWGSRPLAEADEWQPTVRAGDGVARPPPLYGCHPPG